MCSIIRTFCFYLLHRLDSDTTLNSSLKHLVVSTCAPHLAFCLPPRRLPTVTVLTILRPATHALLYPHAALSNAIPEFTYVILVSSSFCRLLVLILFDLAESLVSYTRPWRPFLCLLSPFHSVHCARSLKRHPFSSSCARAE